MKSVILWLLKAFAAGILALVFLCVFSLFYNNIPPAMLVENELNDYPGYPDYFYCYMVEGFGYGKTDKNGYMNLPEVAENDKCDVLMMGSSHMEAVHIPQNLTAASILNAKLNNLNVYNVGLSGRYFLYNCENLQYALEHKKPKYLIIEITDVALNNDQIELALANQLPRISPLGTGIKQYLQKIPYLRLMYHQYTKIGKIFAKPGGVNKPLKSRDNEPLKPNGITSPTPNNNSLLTQLLDKISSIGNENGTRLIIFYHQSLQINRDGIAVPKADLDIVKNFAAACNKADVAFLDMTERFLNEYNDSYILPHGFFNSPIGTGHLNTDGHRMVADELAGVILDMEEEN